MDMNAFNVSATLNVFCLLARPTLCLPHATVSTFAQLPVPLNQAIGKYKNVDIRAVVLDKDNCFAYPHSNEVHKPYKVSYLYFNSSSSRRDLQLQALQHSGLFGSNL
jgi:phosphatidylglycerophosphatase GEP4